MTPAELLKAAEAVMRSGCGPKEARMLAVIAELQPVNSFRLLEAMPGEPESHIYSMIHLLRKKGLIETKQGRGARVHSLSAAGRKIVNVVEVPR